MTSFLTRQLGRPEGVFGGLLLKLLNRVNAEMNRAVLADLPPRPGDRVLEIGFGGGDLMASVLKTPVSSAAGVEVSGPALVAGGRRFAAEIATGRLSLVQAGVEAMPFGDGAFDRVYSCNTLYFWPDLSRPLAEIRRVMAPAGRLAIGHVRVPPAGSIQRSVAEVEAALLTAGFAEVSSRPVRDAFTITTAARS
jgi:ubiquinone/menaquinone biosynthesis C-methylase UbiE